MAIMTLRFADPVSWAISKREFRDFQEFIYREAGIWLPPAKTALLTARLAKRLRDLGSTSFGDYYDLVSRSPEERIRVLDAISTNETRFFREPDHFEMLSARVFPEWIRAAASGHRARAIRVLSAGCSTGQEPYSLAMLLLNHFPNGTGWEIEIVAGDLSTRALQIAKNGIWLADSIKEIPRAYLKQYVLKGFGDQAGKIKAGSEIRSIIQFIRLNLNQPPYQLTGKFDLIFCRNVLIYFDIPARDRAVRHLSEFLSPQGLFFVGHSECLHDLQDVLSLFAPTVYTLVRKPPKENRASA